MYKMEGRVGPPRYQPDPLHLDEEEKEALVKMRIELEETKSIYCPTDDASMIRFLRAKKNNVHDSVRMVKKFFKLKEEEGFREVYDVPCSVAQRILDTNSIVVLKKRDTNGSNIFCIKYSSMNVEELSLAEITLALFLVLDEMTHIEETQKKGCCFILDFGDLTFSQARHLASLLSFRMLRFFVNVCEGSFPMRIKGIYILNLPFLLASIMRFVKLLLKRKLRKRFFTYSTNELVNNFDPNVLPVSLGGTVPNDEARDAELLNRALKNYQYLQDTRKYGYIDCL